jgi:hypothetical protein
MARFFTILTMVLVVIAFLVTVSISKTKGPQCADACGPDPVGGDDRARVSRPAGGVWNPTGIGIVADWACTRSSRFTFIWWLVHAPKTALVWADLPAFALWPSVYMAYALGLATPRRNLPYPFMDPGLQGVGGSRSRSASSAS